MSHRDVDPQPAACRDRVAVPAPPLAFAEMILVGAGALAAGIQPLAGRVVAAGLPAAMDESGRLRVRDAIGFARRRSVSGPVAVVASHDLAYPGCNSLFGFSDRRAQVAIVSTARLAATDDPALRLRRLRNVLAHEAGHLRGLHHCSDPACLMARAGTPDDIDRRAFEPCSRCAVPAPVSFFARLKSVAILAGIAAMLSTLAGLGGAPLQAPFT